MASVIGLNVVERETVSAAVVSGPPIGRSGLVFESARGPVGVAVRLDSEPKAQRVFGGPSRRYNAYYCLKGLWQNAGRQGALAFGTRVVNTSAADPQPAQASGTNPAPYAMTAGQTVVLNANGGGDVTATFTATAGTVTGTAGTFPTGFTGGEDLVFRANGGAPITVTFQAADQTAVQVRDRVLAAAGTGYTADVPAADLRITSTQLGSGSGIEIVGGAALATLGLTAGPNPGTGNVADITDVTFAEVEAVIEAAVAAVAVTRTGPTAGIDITTTLTGSGASITVGAGTANAVLGLTPGPNTGVDAIAGGISSPSSTTFDRGATPVWTFTAGYRGQQDPGAWSVDGVYVEITPSSSDPNLRNVEVFTRQARETTPVSMEFFEDLDADNVVATINSQYSGSEYVTVAIVGADTGVPDQTVGPVSISTDTPGVDGSEAATQADHVAGLASFAGLDIQLVASLHRYDSAWATELEAFVATRGDVLGLFASAQGATRAQVVAEFTTNLRPKSSLAGYRGWLSVADGFGGSVLIPPLGHVIGAGYIRKPRDYGGRPHTAPAGTATALLGVQEVEDSVYGQLQLQELVNGANINPIVYEGGSGFFIKTSRTMSTRNKYVSIHVRLLTNFIVSAFRTNLSSYEQEGNTPTTRRKLRESILTFMRTLDNQEAFETFGGFDNNVRVICDESNNTQNVIRRRRLVCTVIFRPAEIAEEVTVNVTQTEEGLEVTES